MHRRERGNIASRSANVVVRVLFLQRAWFGRENMNSHSLAKKCKHEVKYRT